MKQRQIMVIKHTEKVSYSEAIQIYKVRNPIHRINFANAVKGKFCNCACTCGQKEDAIAEKPEERYVRPTKRQMEKEDYSDNDDTKVAKLSTNSKQWVVEMDVSPNR